jgi:chromosome segregation ATPase
MCKKLFLLALLGAAGVWGYRHYNVHVSRKDNEPLEAQIRRERERLPDLDGEIKKQISHVAAREIELKDLEREISALEKQVDRSRQELSLKETELKERGSPVADTTKDDAEKQRSLRELGRLADAVERQQAELKARKEQREAYRDALNASHEELVAYQNERRALGTQLAELDAMVAGMRTEEIKNRVHFEKTKLAETANRIKELRRKAEVRQKDRELQVRYLGNTTAANTPSLSEKDVLERVKRLTAK